MKECALLSGFHRDTGHILPKNFGIPCCIFYFTVPNYSCIFSPAGVKYLQPLQVRYLFMDHRRLTTESRSFTYFGWARFTGTGFFGMGKIAG